MGASDKKSNSVSESTSVSSCESVVNAIKAIGPGDLKTTYYLKDGGILTFLQLSKEKTIIYEIVHPDQRRVILEKSPYGAVLTLTRPDGKPSKTIGCQY